MEEVPDAPKVPTPIITDWQTRSENPPKVLPTEKFIQEWSLPEIATPSWRSRRGNESPLRQSKVKSAMASISEQVRGVTLREVQIAIALGISIPVMLMLSGY